MSIPLAALAGPRSSGKLRRRASAAGCDTASERIIDAREHGGPLRPETDIDIADDEGSRDAAQADAARDMELIQRVLADAVKHPAGIDEGRGFEAHLLREQI